MAAKLERSRGCLGREIQWQLKQEVTLLAKSVAFRLKMFIAGSFC